MLAAYLATGAQEVLFGLDGGAYQGFVASVSSKTSWQRLFPRRGQQVDPWTRERLPKGEAFQRGMMEGRLTQNEQSELFPEEREMPENVLIEGDWDTRGVTCAPQ